MTRNGMMNRRESVSRLGAARNWRRKSIVRGLAHRRAFSGWVPMALWVCPREGFRLD